MLIFVPFLLQIDMKISTQATLYEDETNLIEVSVDTNRQPVNFSRVR